MSEPSNPQADLQLIAMACPACGAGLSIPPRSERTITCEYCHRSALIPDALWRRLHPVEAKRRATPTSERPTHEHHSAPPSTSGSGDTGESAPPGSLVLWAFKAGELVASRSLADTPIVKIGRVSTAHLQLDDSSVSRMHAVIEAPAPGQLSLIDLGSSSGTYVNGRRVTKSTKLEVGDRIYIGAVQIEVGVAGTRPGPPTAAPAPTAPKESTAAQLIVVTVVMVGFALGVWYLLGL